MEKKKNRFGLGFLVGVLVMVVLVGSAGTGFYLSRKGNTASGKVSENTAEKVDYLEKIINAYYLDDIDKKELANGVYKGLLSGLNDPYSVYYTAEEYRELQESTEGTYCGVGAIVSQNAETGVITVIKIFENAPGDKAGMKDGDVIYKVEGKEVTGENIDKVVSKMKGEKGTKVNITVYRTSENKYIDLEITRDSVDVPTVSYKMLDKKMGIAYIQISQFDNVTYDQFMDAIKALKAKGMKAVIFDVRDNPGGVYDIVCNMLDELLPEGTIVYTKDKYDKEEREMSDADCLNIPMVVLQNENSASASEIFAGAIQDYGVGKIIGTQSFGKGIVQTILPLPDGTAVKITIAKYYTPKDKNIHGKGITPDIDIQQDQSTEADEQLLKAQEVIKEMLEK